MAGGITGGLESLLGIDTTAGNAQLQQALAALQAVGVPTTQQLTLPQLQQYVSAGVLSPQQYQAISANPQAYQQAVQQNLDTSGTTAQKAALQQLGGIAQNGATPIMQAQLAQIRAQQGQQQNALRGANLEQAQQRGVAGGGLEFLNNLTGEQNNATNANAAGLQAGANNAQLALNAITQQGNLGGQLQGQSNQMATNAGNAAQQIAQYNSGLQSAANQYNAQNANQAQQMNLANAQNISNQNTGNANYRTQYNAMVPQTEFNMQAQKAGAIAGNYGQQANLAEQQAQNQNAFTGNLIGAGATLGGDYLAGQALANGSSNNSNTTGSDSSGYNPNTEFSTVPAGYDQTTLPNPNNQPFAMGGEVKCYAQGGEAHDHAICMKLGGKVPGHAQVPGNSMKNDTVPAMLSPHEIVLPRTVSQAPNAPQKAAQFVAQTKGMPNGMPQGKNFADALKMLEDNGLELRLHAKGA